MRFWVFVSILIRNFILSLSLSFFLFTSCLQLLSKNTFCLVWVHPSPLQTRVTSYWTHALLLQAHCPDAELGAVWDEVADPTQTVWISFVLLPFRKSPSSVRWAHILIASLLTIGVKCNGQYTLLSALMNTAAISPGTCSQNSQYCEHLDFPKCHNNTRLHTPHEN